MSEPVPPDFDQGAMVHKLPKARFVERIAFLEALVAGQSVIHVGFADAGCAAMQGRADTWLHAHLARTAAHLVGLDVDAAGVAAARAEGYEAHVVDVRDPAAVAALGLTPADIVVAGEVIEHLDDPGGLLAGAGALVADGGRLVITTPNATGLLNSAAALGGFEVNHPDHVVAFTWRTLSTLLARHGWTVEQTATYAPRPKPTTDRAPKVRALAAGARGVLAVERAVARLGAPFLADGLIVIARR